jgi:hypothetical protein
LPIALDEELIGVFIWRKKDDYRKIRPYIILKPSLYRRFSGTQEWISLAENAMGRWITSALRAILD